MQNDFFKLNKLNTNSKIYFIGIGGISMSGLALMAKRLGFDVAGSDSHDSERLQKLSRAGIVIHNQHHPQWIEDFSPDLVVYTAAIQYWNVELRRSAELGIECVDRSVFLGWLTRSYNNVINIAGTHGKTTTTAMCSEILIQAKRNPTVHLGAEYVGFDNSTVRDGTPGDLLISEACEYKNSLLNFHSTTAVLLNIDKDHFDFFSGIEELIDTFATFAAELPNDGILIYPFNGNFIDKFIIQTIQLREKNNKGKIKFISFGIVNSYSPDKNTKKEDEIPDFIATNIRYEQGYPIFDVYKNKNFFCNVALKVPGEHNILNSLAAIAASNLNGASAESCSIALNEFIGTEGRFSFKGKYKGASIITDYAHHPTSTKKTIEAASKMPHNKLHVIYQPLTFSRVKILFEDYILALKDCKSLVFYEIFSDRESDSLGMSSRLLCDEINNLGGNARFAETYDEIKAYLDNVLEENDIVLFLGPEQIRSFADKLLK